ncbi:MAG: adenylate/guanylate cyclase domain-containing protein, partial [Treponema sp.]|nr:adenylate/guanylate cyclase domain-containing protein [Treponema sp.]
MAKENPHKTRVRFPIGAKLVLIISILVLVSLGTVTVLVSAISTQDVRRTAEDNNLTVNQRAGSQAESAFTALQAAVSLYLETLSRDRGIRDRDSELDSYFFDRNQNIAAIAVSAGGAGWTLIPNEQFFLSNEINAGKAESYITSNIALPVPADGKIRFFNASPDFELPLIAMVFTRRQGSPAPSAGPEAVSPGSETIAVLFSPDELAESFGTGANSSFMINEAGDVLLHADSDLVLGGANFSDLPIVETMQNEGDNNRQVSFTHEGIDYFGAYYRIPQMGAAVFTTIPHSVVFEAVRSVTRQNLFLTAAVLFIAILFIWLFSKTISTPVG